MCPRPRVLLGTEQISNLARLADYLSRLPRDYRHFAMQDFLVVPSGPDFLGPVRARCVEAEYARTGSTEGWTCGTAACALGHGPAAGIPLRFEEFNSKANPLVPDWLAYGQRFCPNYGSSAS